MKTKRNTRAASFLVAIAMFVTMISMFATGANAAQYQLKNIPAGQVIPIQLPNGVTGTITGGSSSNASIAQYSSFTSTAANFLTIAPGTCVVTVNYTTTAGVATSFTTDLTVVNSSTVTANTDSQTMSIVTVGGTANSSYIYTGVTSLTSSSPAVATAAWNASTGYITVTGLTNGTTTITGIGTRSGVQYNIRFTVTVSTSGTSVNTSGVTINGNMITMPVGTSGYTIPTSYYNATVAANNTPTVASAAISGSTGSQYLVVSGLTVGTSIITLNVQTSAGATTTQVSYVVNVVASNTATGGNQVGTPITVEAGKSTTIQGYSEIQTATVKSDNTAIATISPGTNAILVTGVANGTTTITFTAKATGSTALTNYTVTVTVGTGTATSTTTATASNSGTITFTKEKYTLSKSAKGKAYNISSAAKLDGKAIDKNNVLWISTDTSVVSINSKTGQFKVLKSNESARIIVVTKDGKNIGSVEIQTK